MKRMIEIAERAKSQFTGMGWQSQGTTSRTQSFVCVCAVDLRSFVGSVQANFYWIFLSCSHFYDSLETIFIKIKGLIVYMGEFYTKTNKAQLIIYVNLLVHRINGHQPSVSK